MKSANGEIEHDEKHPLKTLSHIHYRRFKLVIFSNIGLMVVNNFDILCILFFPLKTDSVLIIYPDTILIFSISPQHFETISTDFSKVLN